MGRSVMEFTTEGGFFTLEMQVQGLWEVRIPWQVALDGLAAEGVLTADRSQLRKWMDDHTAMFSNMIAARIDDRQPAEVPDDRRVTMVRLEERRKPDHAGSRS
jgi:hypothetical protein